MTYSNIMLKTLSNDLLIDWMKAHFNYLEESIQNCEYEAWADTFFAIITELKDNRGITPLLITDKE